MTYTETERQIIEELKIMRKTNSFSQVTNSYIRILQLQENYSFLAFRRHKKLASKIYHRKQIESI